MINYKLAGKIRVFIIAMCNSFSTNCYVQGRPPTLENGTPAA